LTLWLPHLHDAFRTRLRLTNKEVASELFVSVKTVECHFRNCFMKLDITSRRALATLVN
jgi:DNA-binding NarL/FixJ family response regulator